jgi:hypothetical protein
MIDGRKPSQAEAETWAVNLRGPQRPGRRAGSSQYVFAALTKDARVLHPSFEGLCKDKPEREVKLERKHQ